LIDYSRILGLSRSPSNRRKIEGAISEEGANPVCGDKVTFYLKFEGEKVADASYEAEGCAISLASAAVLAEHAKGKTKEELEKITNKELQKMLEVDLSKNPARLKCALLPLVTLRKAARKQ